MIAGIDHLVLTVADLDAPLDFYRRTLGARVIRDGGRSAAMMFGDQKINVHQHDRTFEPKAAHPTTGAGDFCLIADVSLDEVISRLREAGVSIECGPVARSGARGAMTSVYIRDPDDNLVEVARYDS